MKQPWDDQVFLEDLDKAKIKTKYAKIVLLDFQEKPIKAIEGTITAGTLTVNGAAAIRRTISLTMLASTENANVEDLNNEIALNKKVKIEVGYKNPYVIYKDYGEIVWFKCGIFVLSSASVARSTSTWTISIQGKDKMVLLDGSVGGTLPAATAFHERIDYPDKTQMHLPENERDSVIEHPTIHQIIYELVHHYGKEDPTKIVIADIDEKAKLLVKYIGDSPIYFNEDYSAYTYNSSKKGYNNKFIYNKDVGYFQTDFTYPGELNGKAGDSVVTILNKISQTLGNHEFFYDVDGNFIFQEKKNYLNTVANIKNLSLENYVQVYGDSIRKYTLTDLETVSSINKNPKFDNIKNDFIVWGQRTTEAGATIDIWYHLAIDQKPDLFYVNKVIYTRDIKDENTGIIHKEYTTDIEEDGGWAVLYNIAPQGGWREELYRRALLENQYGASYSDYDQEILAYWRNIFDPNNKNWVDTKGWNPIVENDPRQLNYWIDFIDESAAIGQYSVNMIGRRTKVINDNKIKVLYNTEIPDVIFIPYDDENFEEESFSDGQKWFKLGPELEESFVTSSSGSSAFDKIRELIYLHLNYNTQITIQTAPKYYMEPNNIIYINDAENHINGNFLITQFTLPLAYDGMMSITAQEVLTRV